MIWFPQNPARSTVCSGVETPADGISLATGIFASSAAAFSASVAVAGRGTRKVEYRTPAPRLTRCDVDADMDNARAGKVQHFDTRWSHDVQPVGPRRRIGPASNVMTGNRQQVCRFAGHQHRFAFQDQLSPNQLPDAGRRT